MTRFQFNVDQSIENVFFYVLLFISIPVIDIVAIDLLWPLGEHGDRAFRDELTLGFLLALKIAYWLIGGGLVVVLVRPRIIPSCGWGRIRYFLLLLICISCGAIGHHVAEIVYGHALIFPTSLVIFAVLLLVMKRTGRAADQRPSTTRASSKTEAEKKFKTIL